MPNLDRHLNLPASLFSPGAGADLALEQVEDPEISGEKYFAFSISAQGTIDEIVGMHDEWHGQLRQIDRERRGIFRLSIDAQ